MTKVYKSSVVNAPVEQVWEHIRDFNGLPKWVAPIAGSEIEEGHNSATVGCVRKLTLGGGGGTVRERLEAFSDRDHLCTYTILEAPLPLQNYVSTIKLTPITDGNRTFIEWTGEFDTDKVKEMTNLVGNGVYQSGIDALKKRFGG